MALSPPSSSRRRRRFTVGAVALTAVALLAPGAALAGNTSGTPTLSAPIAQGLAGPLQLSVRNGTVYVAQDFAGVLTKIDRRGKRTDIASNPTGEIAGVEAAADGSIYYTSGFVAPGVPPTSAQLSRISFGRTKVLGDILAHEQANNPDAGSQYGFQSISPDCAAQWPVDLAGPPQYTGLIDSHPYAVAVRGTTAYVADAGVNAILEVRPGRPIRTVAVLPPQPAVITAEAVAANGLPECVTGLTYNFEPVPTDVEIGAGGQLYVTTLPGGFEDASLGGRGAVYRVDPRSGASTKVASGLLGATNLAIGRAGQIYVTQLFGNEVSKIVNGLPQTLMSLPSPAGLEFENGKLYVSYDVFANGTVATISLPRR